MTVQIPLMIPDARPPDLPPLSVEAPFDGAPIGEVAVADAGAVETALGTLRTEAGPMVPMEVTPSSANCARQCAAVCLPGRDFHQRSEYGHPCCGRLNAPAVMVNDHTAFRVDWMPFAGFKQSGLGVGGIPRSMHDMRT